MMTTSLRIGTAEVEITPPLGTFLCGSLKPRPATAVNDPLYVKAIVLEAAGVRLAYAVFDVAMIGRGLGDACVERAARRTGIDPSHIIWSCTHTHSGPYTADWFPFDGSADPVNHAWLATLPERLAECVARADANKTPVTMSVVRATHNNISHNRRLRFKDGREVNTWLLGGADREHQCLGAAGPIDPEIGAIAFDDEQGRLRALLFNFALHANAHFGAGFSGDYPAIVAARVRERYGTQAATLYMPGACGDINPVASCRVTGDAIADRLLTALEARKPAWGGPGGITIGARRREIEVTYRDMTINQDQRIRDSQWASEHQELFRQNLAILRQRGQTRTRSWVHAWHVGEVGFVGLPGELFVELGLRIKRDSPFKWTFPVELCGDYLGYLVTKQAWEAGGYESLISTVALPDLAGVETLMRTGMELLGDLRAR